MKIFKEIIDSPFNDLDLLSVDTGASKKVVGYFRLFDTYNTEAKCNTHTEIEYNQKYTLQYLIDNTIQIDEMYEEEETKKIYKVNHSNKRLQNMCLQRIKLIQNLIDHRNAPIKAETRDLYIFIYYNCCIPLYGQEKAKIECEKLNKQFKEPLKSLNYIFKYVDGNKAGVLKFKNKTIIEWLNITEKEQDIFNFGINAKERAKINTRKKRKQRNQKILKLFKQNRTLEEIAKIVRCCVATVKKVLNINKNPKLRGKLLKKEILKLKGTMKQREVAKKLNIHISTVKKYWNTEKKEVIKKSLLEKTRENINILIEKIKPVNLDITMPKIYNKENYINASIIKMMISKLII